MEITPPKEFTTNIIPHGSFILSSTGGLIDPTGPTTTIVSGVLRIEKGFVTYDTVVYKIV